MADIFRRYSRDGGERRWTSELWERTLPDGTRQFAVEASDDSGARLGSYIQSGEQWYLDYRGSLQSGSGVPGWLPEELTPFPHSIEAVDASLATYDPERIDVRTDGERQLVRVDLGDAPDIGLAQAENDLNEPIEELVWEIAIDSELDRVLDTRVIAIGASGAQLIVSHYAMSAWEELPASDLDAALFAPPEDDGDRGLALRIPDAGTLPANLSVISHYREDVPADGPFSERAIFGDDGGLTVDLTITPKLPGSERTVRYPEGTSIHMAETSLGPVEWTERGDSDALEQAIWEDQAYFYYLSVQLPNTATAGWGADELVAFVEALAAAQLLD